MLILYEALVSPKLQLQKFSPGSLVTIYVHWLGSWLVIAIKGESKPQKCDFFLSAFFKCLFCCDLKLITVPAFGIYLPDQNMQESGFNMVLLNRISRFAWCPQMTQNCNGKVVAPSFFCVLLSDVTLALWKMQACSLFRTSSKEFDFLANAGKAKKCLVESIKFS